MKVYRIDKNGEGPYKYASTFSSLIDYGYSDRHQSPHDDPSLKRVPSLSPYIFGFTSKLQYKRWIYKKRERISVHKKGFTLKIYEAPKSAVVKGKHQIMFLKEAAKVIKEFTLQEIEKI